MRLCTHYQFDEDANRYVPLIAPRYLADKNPSRYHKFTCKRCGYVLHSLDVRYLYDKINNMNRKLSDDTHSPLVDKTDIIDMLAPVPGVYHEDSKYRDNQLR